MVTPMVPRASAGPHDISAYERLCRKYAARRGAHLVVDLVECRGRHLANPKDLEATLTRVARRLGAPVGRIEVQRRDDGRLVARMNAPTRGLKLRIWAWPATHVAVAAASFDEPTAFVDATDEAAERAVELFTVGLGGRRGRSHLLRTVADGVAPVVEQVDAFDFGNAIFEHDRGMQRIEIATGTRGITFLLDDHPQWIEEVERDYHEPLVHLPMVCAPHIGKVGLGGAGDGLALREIVRYDQMGLNEVFMYEIDPFVLTVAAGHPELLRINERALKHPKSRVHAADVHKMLARGAGFDVVILDFPSCSDGPFAHLYSEEFFRQAADAMSDDGVLIIQNTDYEEAMTRTTESIARVFGHVYSVHVPSYLSLDLLLASHGDIEPRRSVAAGARVMSDERAADLLATAERVGDDDETA
jgi:spermidine synthase